MVMETLCWSRWWHCNGSWCSKEKMEGWQRGGGILSLGFLVVWRREGDDNVAHPDWCICVCKDSDTFHHMVGQI